MPDDMTTRLAEDLGIGTLPREDQEKLIMQFTEVALKAATVSVLEKMPEEKRVEFAQLAEAGDAGAVRAFLDTTVPDHETFARAAVQEELRKFKEFQAS